MTRAMQGLEYAVIGGGLLASLGMLLLAILFFSFRKSWASHVGREVGRVQAGQLGWIDLAGVGLVFVFYMFRWIEFGRLEVDQVATVNYLIGEMTLQSGFILMVFGLLRWRTEFEAFWGLKPPRPYFVIGVVFAGFIFYYVVLELLWAVGFDAWVGEQFVRVPLPLVGERTASDGEFWFYWGMATVLTLPFAEEVVFRGYLYPVLKRMGGLWLAAIAVSLFFATVHLDGHHLLGRFILSLILIGAYELTGSLWAPLGIHFLNNAYVFSGNFLE